MLVKQISRLLFIVAVFTTTGGIFAPTSLFATDEGPSFLSRNQSQFGNQEVQFLLFFVADDEADSDVNQIVKEQLGNGRTHEANRSYWISLSQANDQQLVLAWHDKTYGKFQWVRIRWHRESTRVLQLTNGSMGSWRNLSFGDSHRLNFSVGNNRYVLGIENPTADGGWDTNDVIYSFNVFNR